MQCLHTSDDISQRTPASPETAPWSSLVRAPSGAPIAGIPRSTGSATSTGFSMNATCRHVFALSCWVLS